MLNRRALCDLRHTHGVDGSNLRQLLLFAQLPAPAAQRLPLWYETGGVAGEERGVRCPNCRAVADEDVQCCPACTQAHEIKQERDALREALEELAEQLAMFKNAANLSAYDCLVGAKIRKLLAREHS